MRFTLPVVRGAALGAPECVHAACPSDKPVRGRVPHDRTSPTLIAPPPLDLRAHALFLDLDGTLVDIAARPEDVVAGENLRRTLRALTREMHGAVALLTGRTIESADAVLSGAIEAIAGLHGFEHRYNGATTRAEGDLSGIQAALVTARSFRQTGLLPARIEDKRAGFALHYRDNPEAAPVVRNVAEMLAETHGLAVIEGKMVTELTLGVRTKGDALKTFMHEAPFRGRAPVALGDDITDEDAFAAARELGGFGILVGAPRETAATHGLKDAAAVSAWLAASVRT
jgi:trehalose 6-phosphate phosphatase